LRAYHQLPRALKAAEVTDFGHDGGSNKDRNTSEGLDSRNHGRQGPLRNKFGDAALQSVIEFFGPLDSGKQLLEHEMLGRMGELQLAEPAPVRLGPVLAGEHTSVSQQKAMQLLSGFAQILHRLRPHADEVAHGFMRFVGNPYLSQLTRAQQLCSDELDALVNRFAVFVRDLKSLDKSHHRWTFADMGTAAQINRAAGRYSSRGWEADVVEVDIVGLDEAKWTSLHTQLLEEPSDSPRYRRLLRSERRGGWVRQWGDARRARMRYGLF